MPGFDGFSACLSTRRRPTPDSAPTDTKASCLYPNAGRALQEARDRGFNNCVMLDAMGNVAEFATANLFIAKDGVLMTPQESGSFLNGVTRQRVLKLMRDRGENVVECRLTPEDLADADEMFNTGNYGKLMPVIRYEDRDLQPGPMFRLARDLYWEFAHKNG
jgi:branched-chain amino acid aminotransferase